MKQILASKSTRKGCSRPENGVQVADGSNPSAPIFEAKIHRRRGEKGFKLTISQ